MAKNALFEVLNAKRYQRNGDAQTNTRQQSRSVRDDGPPARGLHGRLLNNRHNPPYARRDYALKGEIKGNTVYL